MESALFVFLNTTRFLPDAESDIETNTNAKKKIKHIIFR